MRVRSLVFGLLAAAVLVPISGCRKSSGGSSGKAVVFFSITRDGKPEGEDLQRLDMALKLAGFSLDEKRKVVIFFNIRGVHVPTKDFNGELQYGDKEDDTIKAQLAKLIERGAEVHVCPICMKALGVDKEDIIKGAQVTTRPKLFAHIGGNTTVFTY